MRLSDIMGAMHLSAYAEIALVLFVAAFGAITFQVFSRKQAATWEAARHLPLADDPTAPDDSKAPASHPQDSTSP